MILRTDTKILVMAALADGPRHGYALAKAMQESLGPFQRLSGGQVYVALRGLEADGWVVSEWDGDGAERRVYRLTDEGQTELAWRSAEWHECARAIARILPKGAVPALAR